MSLFSQVRSIPSICGIELAFTGALLPSIIEGYQPFVNALTQGTDFTPTHFGRATVSFNEESEESSAGTSWRQKLTIRFPGTDSSRSYRLDAILKVKFVKIKLSNGLDFVIGRNDFEQNAKPIIKINTNETIAQAEFETVSIFPTGYTPNADAGGLPDFIPLDLITDI
jgi:hypothetical protein